MAIDVRRTVLDPVAATAQHLAADWPAAYQLRPESTWWHFDPVTDRPHRQQGWKLHVSAVPVTAVETLTRVAAVVMPRGLRWKTTRSMAHLTRLGTPPTPVSQVGKFITIYLDDDDHLPDLAAALHAATRHLDGPTVPSDHRYCRGSNLYLRYGAFVSRSDFAGTEQVRRSFMVDPEGGRVVDQRAPGRRWPQWAPDPPLLPSTRRPRDGGGLFGRGITVTGLLHQSAKGGVYRGTWGGRDVVIKEGRAGTCTDIIGRDTRARLRNEWTILRRLAGTGLAPEPLDFFIEQDNAYLIEQFLPGVTLRTHIETINYQGPIDPVSLRAICHAVTDLGERLLSHDICPRDFTPNNILVNDGRYAVIDVELFNVTGSGEPSFDGWTPGYARPTVLGRAWQRADHDHTTAAIHHFVMTGIDPFLTLSEDPAPHIDELLTRFGPADTDTVADILAPIRAHLGDGSRRTATGPSSPEQVVADAVEAGDELVRRVEWDNPSWPWPSAWASSFYHPASFQAGTAGIAQYYLDLWHATGDRDWVHRADELLEWTFDTFPYAPGGDHPPGLHFGLGAVPWLMSTVAGLLGNERTPVLRERAATLIGALAAADNDSWDITHGRAGIALAQLAMAAPGDPGLAGIAHRIRAGAVEQDGLLTWPRGTQYSYGYAHGSAGIGYVLLHAGLATADPGAVTDALGIAHALVRRAVPTVDGEASSWHHGPQPAGAPWTHWCNGAAGVGMFLADAWRASHDPDLRDAAIRAGRAITRARAFGSCCRCHGLAGDGDYLLELAACTDPEGEFRDGADRIAGKLDALRIRSGFAWKWPHEGAGEPRPSYMRGYLGVHAFRLRHAGVLPGAPLMITTPIGEHP